jgi:hypothetical protein
MSETGTGPGPPIPADVIPQLTSLALVLARRCAENSPATFTAAATTHVQALHLLFGGTRGLPGNLETPVYVVVMTGRFTGYRHPYGVPAPTGSVLTLVFDADMLSLLDLSLGDSDNAAPLSRLGPVTTLPRK